MTYNQEAAMLLVLNVMWLAIAVINLLAFLRMRRNRREMDLLLKTIQIANRAFRNDIKATGLPLPPSALDEDEQPKVVH